MVTGVSALIVCEGRPLRTRESLHEEPSAASRRAVRMRELIHDSEEAGVRRLSDTADCGIRNRGCHANVIHILATTVDDGFITVIAHNIGRIA